MHWVVVLHLAAVSAYAGFQWTVRVVVYPQFAGVPAPSFAAYEAAHQRRLSLVVGPLFGAVAVTTSLSDSVRPIHEARSAWGECADVLIGGPCRDASGWMKDGGRQIGRVSVTNGRNASRSRPRVILSTRLAVA